MNILGRQPKIKWTRGKTKCAIYTHFEKTNGFNLYFPCAMDGRFMLWNQLTGEIKYFPHESGAKDCVETTMRKEKQFLLNVGFKKRDID